DALEQTGMGLEQLQANSALFFELVVKPNTARTEAFRKSFSPRALKKVFVPPAVFDGEAEWSQPMFMTVFLQLIESRIKRLRARDGWEYSNGCLKEFFLAFMMKAGYRARSDIDIVKQNGTPLDPCEAYRLIFHAMQRISKFKRPKLHARVLIEMSWI